MTVIVTPCRIGAYTYAGEHTHIAQRTSIGRYCSIGNLCTIGAQRHAIERFTTFPLNGVEDDGQETVIGHDVWIGCNSVIVSGIKIGTGAVIGAGSVVTRDVEPYAIVYGNPAKFARWRFKQPEIDRLMASKWWELPIEKLKELEFIDGKSPR